MRAVFRFESSSRIGLGHKSRCLSLARCLSHADGFEGTTIAHDEGAQSPLLDFVRLEHSPDDPSEFVTHISRLRPDVIVVDNYALGPEWFDEVTTTGTPILRISDWPSPAMGCSYILDPSPAHSAHDYEIDDPQCTLMVGSSWAPLDASFFNERHRAHADGDAANRVLIALGSGRRAADFATEILHHLAKVEDLLAITVVAPDDEVERAANDLAGGSHHHVRHWSSTSNMAQLMRSHDVAIGSGGVTALERCVVGLPSAIIAVADNQNPNVAAMLAAGAAIECELGDVVGSLERVRQQGLAVGAAARALCDGLGALRCAREIGARIPVMLRQANAGDDDKRLAFGHQTIPGIRMHSRTPAAPDWDDHSSWYDDAITRDDRNLYFIEVGGFTVGQIRLDQLADGDGEVSILLVPEARGMSIASEAIRSLAARSLQSLVAHIEPENQPSTAAFRAAGFDAIGPDRYRLTRGTG